jgi:hypothetical protein
MAAKKKIKKEKVVLTEEELLKPLPALVLPEETEVILPDADNKLAAQKEFLELRLAAVLGMEMNEANLEKVKTVKKGIVGWRNTFKKQCDDYVKGVYKGPMEVFKTAADAVMDDIAEMESKCDEILDREEEKRRAQVNAAIDGIIEDLKDELNFDFTPERKKEYYNKTADMKAVMQDLREQFNTAIAAAKQAEADRRMIERACKGDERLNADTYIGMLAYEPASLIVEKIEAEKERLAALNSTPAPEPVSEPETEEPKMVIGVKVNPEAMKSDFAGLTKKMAIELEYPVDLGDELTRIFDELRKNGVKMRVLKVVEPDMPKF